MSSRSCAEENAVSPEVRERILAALAEKKPVMLGDIASRFGLSELDIARLLPGDICGFAVAEAFEQVWTGLAGWEKATLIVTHLGNVLEIKGRMPQGSFGHGYFNLMDKENPIGGHLKVDGLAVIAFISLPFMGLESHSVQFFNADGAVMLSVYAGRENRQLVPRVRESFINMRQALCRENIL